MSFCTMRVVAESMAEVAMRLAQPETVARESIVTVGQAIRREVAAMVRVSEFVTAMNEVTASTGNATGRVETNIAAFRDITAQVIGDLGQLARQLDIHGRDLVKAVEIIDHSNQRTEDGVNERCVQLDSLIATLDIRTEDIEKRLTRFSGLLDESLDAASTRAREVARLVSEASAEGTRAISEQYERVRENAEGERQRSAEAMRAIYEQSAGETQALFQSANERFAESVNGMVFAVSDNGPGIAPDDMKHLFDRFWQARDTDSRGIGLGLAISKGIVEAHRGRIWADSEPGLGSTFAFSIPGSTKPGVAA